MTLEPLFCDVPASAGHYESIYLVANSPDEPVAVWIRYTVHKRPNRPATGSIWFTRFAPDGPTAVKVTVPDPFAGGQRLLVVGEHGSVRADRAVGNISGPGGTASWELAFEPTTGELRHLPHPWMYRASVPRTKSTSPYPAMRVTGTVTVGDRRLALDGWRGMLGHNWGAEHAHRWIWLRAASFDEDPDAWLDVVIGRIKVGPLVVPWIANGVLARSGGKVRHRVGGLGRRVRVHERRDGCDLVLPGHDLGLTVHVSAPLEASVGWEYADPSGARHQVRNCSTAGVTLDIRRTKLAGTRLSTAHGGAYELGSAEFDPSVPIQPDPDG